MGDHGHEGEIDQHADGETRETSVQPPDAFFPVHQPEAVSCVVVPNGIWLEGLS